jgi:phage gp29-like protein
MPEGQGPVDSGSGPPAGSPSASPWAQQIPADQLQRVVDRDLGGAPRIRRDDPAFQPPFDPLKGTAVRDTRIVYRDLPLVNSTVDWTVDQMSAALRANMWGVFEAPGQLADAILGDDRVQATLGSRISGLFGREVRFRPADDSLAAKECLLAWERVWPAVAPAHVMTQLQAYSILMGWMPAQINWDTSAPVWCPYLYPWHPRYTYYHWNLRRYVALSQDGQLPIMAGNGKWLLHAPFGEYRGWVRGAIRAVAEPWLIRHWAIRDWARFSEVHGMPIKKAIVPASAEQGQRDAYEAALSQLATETTLMVTQGNDGTNHYDFELVEAKDTAWESFPGLRDHCDMAIVLAIMFQNLTTEVKGGSFAATTAHMDIRQGGIQADNASWRWTLREQVARPFAWLNFGDPFLAPITDWDVTPREEYEHNAKQFLELGKGIQTLRVGGVKFVDTEQLRAFVAKKFGLDELPDFEMVDPVASGGMGGGGGSFGQ